MATHTRIHLPDEHATERLARQLALPVTDRIGQPENAPPGPKAGGRIHLRGELGAGKTAFTRALLRASGVTGRIKSPSYALLESYKVFNLYFYHFDFYRFGDPREWLDAGFRDAFRDDAVVVIEWPERAADLLPAPDLEVFLAYAEQGRDADLHAHTVRGQLWLNALTTRQSASLVLQDEVKRGSIHSEPKAPLNGGGEAPGASPEFFTTPSRLP